MVLCLKIFLLSKFRILANPMAPHIMVNFQLRKSSQLAKISFRYSLIFVFGIEKKISSYTHRDIKWVLQVVFKLKLE